jgi:hypothetical protein
MATLLRAGSGLLAERVCKECGTSFKARSNNAKWCEGCRDEMRARPKDYHRGWYLRNREEIIARSVRNKQRKAALKRRAEHLEASAHKGQKKCVSCQEWKWRSQFALSRARKDGLYSYCRSCHSAMTRPRRKQRAPMVRAFFAERRATARDYVEKAKQAPCSDCGLRWPPKVLHFHHLDPSTKGISVARHISQGSRPERIQEEIDKCVLLCANCHILRHLEVVT